MFKFKSLWTIYTLMAAQLLSWSVWLMEEKAFADPIPTNTCCNPAHAATPTPPAGSGGSCVWAAPTCGNTGGTQTCSGIAWQDAVAGTCQSLNGSSCTNPPQSGATTLVTINKGYWQCNKNATGAGNCNCVWYINDNGQNQLQVGNCTGGGC